MTISPIKLIEEKPRWHLWALVSLASVAAIEFIMCVMGWLLKGDVTRGDLLTGLVAAGVVTPVSLVVMSRWLAADSALKQQAAELERQQAQNNLQVCLDAARMVFWELDLATRQISFDDSRLHWLGLTQVQALHSLDHWLAHIHSDDQASVRSAFTACLSHGAGDLDVTYRMRCERGDCLWVHSVGRVVRHNSQGEALLLAGGSVSVTERKAAELALVSARMLQRLVSDNVPDMIWAKDLNKKYLFANKAICEQLLFATSLDEPLGKDDLFFANRERAGQSDPQTWHTFGEGCQDSDAQTLLNNQASQFDEFGYVRGQFVFFDVHKAPLLDDNGVVIGVVGSARNVTGQKSADEKLRLAAMVLDNSSEAMLVTDANNHIIDVNPAFTTLTGYTLDEAIGQNPSFLQSGRQSKDFFQSMWVDIQTHGHWQGELWNRRKNGEVFAEWLTVNTIYHADGSVNRRVGLFSDITQKKHAEELVWRQANFDPLTNLPNRRMFYDRLGQDLIKAQRSGLKLAVFFLDLDNFKEVNDAQGHDVGDILLRQAAQRIASCVRASDSVARLGGDEFTVILSELDDPSRVEIIATEIISLLSQPFLLDGQTAQVTASVGITVFPDDATDLELLMQNADQAMYAAKRAGRNRFSYYTRAMQVQAQDRMSLLSDLKAALLNGQLQLYFQPIVDLKTGIPHKVEALLRWFHPERGMVGPAEFIPLAEESGLIHAVGDWVFAEALRQSKRWASVMGKEFKIALNVSPLQLLRSNVHHIHWREQLASSGISGQNFVIEISEGLLHDTSEAVTSQLKEFRDSGTEVSVDDFGSGCSSFFELKKRHIEYFKIEKSFVQKLLPGGDDLALAEAVVVMAHHLGLKVIAEGVETQVQHDLLVTLGCDFGQGYFYSKPVAAVDVAPFFTRNLPTGLQL